MNRYTVIAVVTSVAVFLLSSTIFFIVGCLCGCFFNKYKECWKLCKNKSKTKMKKRTTVDMYDDVLPPNRGRTLKLRQNLAYETKSVNSEVANSNSETDDS